MSDTWKTESPSIEAPTKRIKTAPLQRSIRSETRSGAQSTANAERIRLLQALDDVLSNALEALRSDDAALPAIGLRGREH